MSTFLAVDDTLLASYIDKARCRVVFVAPAVSRIVAEALGRCFNHADQLSVTVILDPDEDVYRVGYGEPEGLELLQQLAANTMIALRSHPGVRIGMLLADDDVLIWSPTPKAVEATRTETQPNGLMLGNTLSQQLGNAVGADDSQVLVREAEIGKAPLMSSEVEKTLKRLEQNPPAPFDLAQVTRVFSTKFQFVEFELRGAEWTKREIKLSSLLLNPDVPDELQEIFETRVKPFSHKSDLAIPVPVLVQGQAAYTREGQPILAPATQADIEKMWKELRDRYLMKLPGFGWLIRHVDKARFKEDVQTFEEILVTWVKGFREQAQADERSLIVQIVNLIKSRTQKASGNVKSQDVDIPGMVSNGLKRLRIVEPRVKLIFKNISPESTRDMEFVDALERHLPAEDLKGWFEEFSAARQSLDRQADLFPG